MKTYPRLWELVQQKLDKTESCWLWTGYKDADGYGRITDTKKPIGVHRIAWIVANDAIPPGLCVCHRCDVRHCVNPDHLFLGTPGDNTRDRDSKGRHARIPRKLTWEMVNEIRRLHKKEWRGPNSSVKLGARFGVSSHTVELIVHNKIWKPLNVEQVTMIATPETTSVPDSERSKVLCD